MNTIRLLAVCAIGVVIAAVSYDNSEPEIDPRLREHVVSWKAMMDSAGIEVEAGFRRLDRIVVSDDLPLGKLGQASRGRGTVLISQSVLDQGQAETEWVVWHELGHAVFGLGHTETGIMAPTPIDANDTAGRRARISEYLEECRAHEYNSAN